MSEPELVTALESAIRRIVREELLATTPIAGAPERLLSVDEAASMLGVARPTLYDLVARAEVPILKVGSRRLVPAAAITEFIASREA